MSVIEQDLIRDAAFARLQITGALAGGMVAFDHKTAMKFPKASLDSYLGLTLPYQFKKAKIKSTFDKQDLKQLSEILIKKNKLIANAKR